ncbi:MAG: patatin-like phospholipase family protein [Proteobacteria bacterium]|nr:patatin-like phospholipase family protein [Pseudomonadota bacterium]
MLSLEQIPLLAGMSQETLRWLQTVVGKRCFDPGEPLVRAGEPGECIYLIADGAARVDLPDAGPGRRRAAFLGPGESIGEISMLTGLPISATAVAIRRVAAFALTARDFSELISREPAFHRSLSMLLAERLRARTGPGLHSGRPTVIAWVDTLGSGASRALGDRVGECIQRLVPASRVRQVDSTTFVHSDGQSFVQSHHSASAEECFLLLRTGVETAPTVLAALELGDLAFIVTDVPGALQVHRKLPEPLVEQELVIMGERERVLAGLPRWPFVAPEVETGVESPEGSQVAEAIARHATNRTVGVAMSVGAAAGLAHFGALEVLQRAGLPLDYLCGSSMGGVAALMVARQGDARAACKEAKEMIGSNAAVRDLAWLPRSALYSGERIRRMTQQVFQDQSFPHLHRPAAVVAADVVANRRVVIDSGVVSRALQATIAIPGLFPPVRVGDQVLVDGGIVSCIPADLLTWRRCGYRVAITVRPELAFLPGEEHQAAVKLESEMSRVFGLRSVVTASWRLLGWWDVEQQAHGADAVIRITTPRGAGFNFDAAERLVELGQGAATEQLDALKSGWSRVLRGV